LARKWIGGTPLCLAYPQLFRIESNKEISIANRGIWDDGEWRWQWTWSETLSSTETEALTELEGVLEGIRPLTDVEDNRRWIADSSGIFTVNSCYRFLSSYAHIEYLNHDVVRTLQALWLNDIPYKINIFG
jgi:hypothetical protein